MNISKSLLDPLAKKKIRATRGGSGYVRALPSPIKHVRNKVHDKRMHPKPY
jgi:hypothetical protein